MKRLLACCALLVAFSVVPSTEAEAQCTVKINTCIPSGHTADETGGSFGIGLGTHGDCRACMFNGNEVPAGTCHECASLLTDDARAAYQVVLTAARAGDVGRVLKLAGRAQGRVVFNASRNALQVTNCSGDAILASLPVTDAGQRFAAQSLAAQRPAIRAEWQVAVGHQ